MRMADILNPRAMRLSPRRHKLTPEECARLKYLIRTRLKTEDYRCRMPDARVHFIGKVDDFCRPVYRLRLRTEVGRFIPKGRKKMWFVPNRKVWM